MPEYAKPRPGRSYCCAVETDCLAPAGIATGMGTAGMPGVRRADLYTCVLCGQPVCQNCSVVTEATRRRVCVTHNHR